MIVGADRLCYEARYHLCGGGCEKLFKFEDDPEGVIFGTELPQVDFREKRCNMIVYPVSSDGLSQADLISLVRKKFLGITVCNRLAFYYCSVQNLGRGSDIKLILIGRHKLKLSRFKGTNNFVF